MAGGYPREVRAAAAPSWTITCPKCQHEWQTLKVGRRARTCPKCGHVGPRADFPERATPDGNPAPAEDHKVGKPKAEEHRPLTGAALAAHEAKARGERVKVPAERKRSSSSSSSDEPSGSRRASTSSSSTKSPSLIDRLRRVI